MLQKTLALALALICLLTTAAAADTSADLATMFQAAYAADEPGGAVLVVAGGEVLHRAGHGLADLERPAPITPETVFRLGSITKQFTAVAIMMLAEEGELAVTDSVQQHLPDFPHKGRTITIEHLLTHTSGLQSYTDLPEVMENAHLPLTVDEVIATFQDLDLHFDPGTEWRYCNSGYFLLGAIIESVAGVPYAEFIQARIFTPLGMSGSYYGSHEQVIPHRALGYNRTDDGFTNAPYISMSLPYAAGSLLSTVDDLHRWQRAMEDDALVSRATRERMWTSYVLADGEETGYGYGWALGQYEGERVVMHGGGIHGFSTNALAIPSRGVFVAVLSNSPHHAFSPQSLCQKAVGLTQGEAPPVEATDVDTATLERYVGVYRIDQETTRVVTVEDGVLHTHRSNGARLAARPLSATEFFYDRSASRFRFELDDAGNVVGMRMKPWGRAEEPAVLTDEPIPAGPEVADVDPAIYDRYAGTYELMPGFELTVARDGDRLMLQATGQPEVEAFPSSETEFFLTVVEATLEFDVDPATGQATRVTLRQGGTEMVGERKP